MSRVADLVKAKAVEQNIRANQDPSSILPDLQVKAKT